MLRLYWLQNLYDLSNEATVVEAIDSRSFSTFCRVDPNNQVLNGGTLDVWFLLFITQQP